MEWIALVLVGLLGGGGSDRSGWRKARGVRALKRLDPNSNCRRSGLVELEWVGVTRCSKCIFYIEYLTL
jgi:hypothetical protein